MRPNAHVQAQLDAQRDTWDKGAVAGYEAKSRDYPDWIVKLFRTTPVDKRGYLLGVLLRERERMDEAE